MEPHVAVDRDGLSTVFSNVNFCMDRFQNGNEAGYTHSQQVKRYSRRTKSQENQEGFEIKDEVG